ncbi:uncharacterized protein EI90DRAFT_1759128 [Cantharellus anzutake]|uniref:uncharacterized protein n=1 Tax=Cantharellus anzutake TaxID=1750568 RepID=UPI00190741EA|nr:uncharacterized protein EI90DRAFT_1759128 [Cantharellus anzutake]KAF8341610.1 hypothetical protein EI90DRAFT_1759128 [Cantharellus anzutake]
MLMDCPITDSSSRDIQTQASPSRAYSCRKQIRVPTHTQERVRESLLRLLNEAENRFVWLRGSPGTGKTAISMSIASTLKEQGTLAASFFWDKNRTGTGLDSIELFPSTLACQLASFNEDFKLSLIRRLRQSDMMFVQDAPPEKQINTLMIEPMRDLKDIFSSGKDQRFFIILDGLDECGDQETLRSLVRLVVSLEELPSAFSVLVSCRPEPGVISAWSTARNKGHVVPCEDLDRIMNDEGFYTVRRMVEDGLQHVINNLHGDQRSGNSMILFGLVGGYLLLRLSEFAISACRHGVAAPYSRCSGSS